MKPTQWLALTVLLLVSASLQAQIDLNLEPDNENLRRNIEIHIGEVEGRSARELRRTASYVREQARQALRALGYYNARISTEVDPEGPRLQVNINAGEPVRFSDVRVRIEGPGEDFAGFELPEARIPNEGERLDHSRYEDLKSLIRNRAQIYGFFNGQFTQQRLRIDPEAGTAEVDLVFRTGERFTLGEVTFSDDVVFDDELLQRFVEFEPGTPYESRLVAELNQNLRISGYFEQILVNAAPDRAVDGRIPVHVQLTERKPNSIGVGAGFSTDVGPRARLTWTEHWINEKGHQRGAETELSAPRQTLGAWYEIPLDPPMTDSLRFTTGYQREEIEDVESRLFTLGAEYRHRTSNNWQQVISVDWQDERYEVGDESGHSRLLLPGLSLDKLQTDDSIDPSEGYRLQLQSRVASQALLSSVDVVQIIVSARGLTTLADRHRLLARAQVGAIATNEFEDVPPSLRFFAGGDQSVRGYGYRSLGPTDAEGNNLGGRYLLESSIEYQYELVENWRVATFVDHGNAVENFNDSLKTGIGAGVRWVSPVGPLRLDVAHGLNDRAWRIHFSMGLEI